MVVFSRSPAKAGAQAHAPNWTPAFAGELLGAVL
jgi:hypothetical protein